MAAWKPISSGGAKTGTPTHREAQRMTGRSSPDGGCRPQNLCRCRAGRSRATPTPASAPERTTARARNERPTARWRHKPAEEPDPGQETSSAGPECSPLMMPKLSTGFGGDSGGISRAARRPSHRPHHRGRGVEDPADPRRPRKGTGQVGYVLDRTAFRRLAASDEHAPSGIRGLMKRMWSSTSTRVRLTWLGIDGRSAQSVRSSRWSAARLSQSRTVAGLTPNCRPADRTDAPSRTAATIARRRSSTRCAPGLCSCHHHPCSRLSRGYCSGGCGTQVFRTLCHLALPGLSPGHLVRERPDFRPRHAQRSRRLSHGSERSRR